MQIPKIIHRIWLKDEDGDDRVSDEYEALYESFRRDYPDWEHKLWTDANLPGPEDRITGNMIDLMPNVGMKADVIRAEIIHTFGGMYVDIDVESKKNAEELLSPYNTFTFKQGAGVGNHVLGSVKDCRILKEMLKHFTKERIAVKLFSGNIRDTMSLTGPIIMTRFMTSYYDGTLIGKSAWQQYMIHHQAGLWWRGKGDHKDVLAKELEPGKEGCCEPRGK